MRTVRTALVVLQALTMPGLASLLLAEGQVRLALAQILLAVVTVLVYL